MAMTKEQALALASARLRLQQSKAAPQPEEPGMLDKVGRAFGYQGKAAIQGALALPAMGGDLLAYPINAISRLSGGKDVFPPQQQAIKNLLTNMGLPDPKNDTEQLFAAGAGGLGAAASGIGLGGQLARAASPAVAGIGNILRAAPASQAAAGAAGGVSSELAGQQGYGAVGQGVAGIVGGMGAGMAAQKVLPALWSAPQVLQQPKSAVTGMSGKAAQAHKLNKVTEESAFGKLKEVFPDEVSSNLDRTAQYRKAVQILDKSGVQLTKGQRSGIDSVKMTETTLAQMPIVGRPLQNTFDKTRQTYQKTLLKMAGNEAGDSMITPESLQRTGNALSQRYSQSLKGKSVSISDDDFLNELGAIEIKHTDLVDSSTATKIKQIVDSFLNKAIKEGGYTGEKYQAQRSLFAERAKGTGEKAALYSDLKDALDNAFHRAAGGKGNLDNQWAQYKQLQSIYNNNGGALMSEGFISPIQVARKASGAPGSQQWRDFTRAASAVIPDRVNNSGTAQRQLITKAATGGLGAGIGVGAMLEPVSATITAGSLLGARGLAGYLAKQPGQATQYRSLLYPSILGAQQK